MFGGRLESTTDTWWFWCHLRFRSVKESLLHMFSSIHKPTGRSEDEHHVENMLKPEMDPSTVPLAYLARCFSMGEGLNIALKCLRRPSDYTAVSRSRLSQACIYEGQGFFY